MNRFPSRTNRVTHNGLNTFVIVFMVFVVILIGVSIAVNIVGAINGNSEYSFGLNGIVETRCQGGYKVVINQEGHIVQLLDSFGKGVRC